MKRRTFIAAGLSCLSPFTAQIARAGSGAGRRNANQTRWRVLPSIGLDAGFALTIAAAGSEVLQAKKHEHRRDALRKALGAEGVAAAQALMETMKRAGVRVPGAQLALLASTGDVMSLDGVVETFSAKGDFARRFEGTGFFQKPGAFEALERRRPAMAAAYEALARSGFEAHWRAEEEAQLREASLRIGEELAHVDVVTACKRYLATHFDSQITIYLSVLSEPHGIRIVGQRFVTSPNYDTFIVRRNAAHEMLHPLLRAGRPETERILERLREEPLLLAIAEKSNPSFGYSSVRGLAEEGGVQALEAVINERLGQARDQAAYWRKQDGGMHLFAAAAYQLMRDTGFAETGGDMLAWLDRQTAQGRLQGEALQRLAEAVVGRAAVVRWLDPDTDVPGQVR